MGFVSTFSSNNNQNLDPYKLLGTGLTDAQNQLTTGFTNAQNVTNAGFDAARTQAQTGYGTASSQLQAAGNQAVDTAKQGIGKSESYYSSPEVIASRQELYDRVLGKGGLSHDTLDKMKASSVEQYGTGARQLQDSLNSMYGDSEARGMTGENLARGVSDLWSKRANSIRDIDIGNEQLARQEQGNAIGSLENEAATRAGLSLSGAQMLSGLQEHLGEAGAGLTAQEANLLSQLASQQGVSVGQLMGQLAAGQAGLSTDYAKSMSELWSNQQANQALIDQANKPSLGNLFGLL